MTPDSPDSELQESRARLAEWLASVLEQQVDAGQVAISTPGEGGWSNDTWMVTTGSSAQPRAVVRLQPQRASMFPTYNLHRQLACLSLLEGHAEIPTPRVISADLEGRWLGRPAFIMDHVAGLVPRDDSPTFAEAGWLFEADTQQQRIFHTSLLDSLAAIHAVEPDELGDLAESSGTHSNRIALVDLREIWAFDQGSTRPSIVERALDKLAVDVPEPTSECLLWGDARPANVITDPATFEPAALVDWELATVGSPERDLLWLMEMNWMRAQGAGLAPLPGFLTDQQTIQHYTKQTGRRLRRLDWYRSFAAARVAVFMHRYLRAQVHTGRLDEGHRILRANVASRRLEALLT